MQSVLSDTAWSAWELLIEEVRPKENPHRRTLTDDIRDFLAPSERREMACHVTGVLPMVDRGIGVHSIVEAGGFGKLLGSDMFCVIPFLVR